MTLSEFQRHSAIATLLEWDFSYSCAAVDVISTDIARRAVIAEPLAYILRHISCLRNR